MAFDPDYGVYRGASGDPRTPDDDDRSIDELTPTEQRALLATLSHADLVQQCLDSLADAALWYAQFQREQRARQVAEARLRQIANDAQQVAA